MMPLLKMPTTTATPATGAIVTLPRYTAECPIRTALYMRLITTAVSDFTDQDRADWLTATGWQMTVRLTPIVACRCCGCEMDVKWQSPITASRPGFHYVTCFAEGCKLHGFTFTDNNYAEQDLSAYLAKPVTR